MTKKKLGGFLGALAGIAAAIIAAKQPHRSAPPIITTADTAASRQACADIFDQELHRGIDPNGQAECLRRIQGGAQDADLRTWIRASDEYAALQEWLKEPPPVHLPPLTVCGEFFCADGQPWTAIESSEFSLFKRYLAGEDVTPVLAERRDLGFNLLRVWLLNASVIPGGLQPKDYPDFYQRLPVFLHLCEQYGFRVELTAFTQTPLLMPSVSDQRQHWQRTQDAVMGASNVLLELVNEYNHGSPPDNAPDRSLWSMRPAGILASSGSADADDAPPEPVWDYVLYHSNGLSEFQRKVGHNAMEYAEKYHLPAMANENTRYPDQDASEQHAYDAAAGAALLTAGSCFHSQAGKLSVPFSADERRYAAAWVAGAKSVPLEFRTGAYVRRDDLNGPNVIRAYEKRLPDGRSYVLRIRP